MNHFENPSEKFFLGKNIIIIIIIIIVIIMMNVKIICCFYRSMFGNFFRVLSITGKLYILGLKSAAPCRCISK